MAKQVLIPKTEKWTIPQIEMLIDSYKKETCLYATDQANYHNKRVRGKALGRVSESLKLLRPTTTPKECLNKFHNLRNQYNIEYAKVRASYKSGIGTDNIYQPALWYFPKLAFLESYVKSRKRRNSLEKEDDTSGSAIETSCQQSEVFEGSVDMSTVIDPADIVMEMEDHLSSTDTEQDIRAITPTSSSPVPSTHLPGSSVCTLHADVRQARQAFMLPGHNSPPLSLPSSAQSSESQRKSKRTRRDSSDSDFAVAIHDLAESMKQPITINTIQSPRNTVSSDPVDTFANFIGSLLRTFQDEELKLELMKNITRTVINARSGELQRAKK